MKGGILKEQNKIFKILTLSGILVIFFVKYFLINPHLEKMQEEINKRDVKNVHFVFSRTFEQMKNMLRDNAQWLELYQAVEDNDLSFLKNSYDIGTMSIYSVDYLGFFNKKKEEIYGLAEEDIYKNIKGVLAENRGEILSSQSPGEGYYRMGLINYNGERYLYASHLILDNIKNEKSAGSMLFFKRLDNEYIKKLSKEVQLNITLLPQINLQYMEDVRGGRESERYFTLSKNNVTKLYIPIYDNRHNPIFAVELLQDDRVYRNYSMGMFEDFIFVLIFLFMVYLTNLRIRKLTDPVMKLYEHIESVERTGVYSKLEHESKRNEIDLLIHSCNRLVETTKSRDKELKKKNVLLKKMAYMDSLTQVCSRRMLQDKIPKIFKSAKGNTLEISVLMVDIDNFKKYNDNYGHIQGDRILIKISKILKDVFSMGYTVRYGGEEFMVFLVGEATLDLSERLSLLTDRLRGENLEHNASAEGRVTVSVGVYEGIPEAGNDIEYYIRLADEALYRAKAEGRNRTVYYKEL